MLPLKESRARRSRQGNLPPRWTPNLLALRGWCEYASPYAFLSHSLIPSLSLSLSLSLTHAFSPSPALSLSFSLALCLSLAGSRLLPLSVLQMAARQRFV